MGGEYNNGSAVWTTKGALYNPATNKWSNLTAPSGWTSVGDAQSIILPSGKLMLANCCTTQEAILTLTGSTDLVGNDRHRQIRLERRRRLDPASRRQNSDRRCLCRPVIVLQIGLPDLQSHHWRLDDTDQQHDCQPCRSGIS